MELVQPIRDKNKIEAMKKILKAQSLRDHCANVNQKVDHCAN